MLQEKMMSVAIRKYLFETALLTVLTTGIGAWIFHSLRPALFLADYVWIPVYFYVFGGLLMAGVTKNSKEGSDPKKLVQAYLLARIIKMFVSVIAVVVFCLAVHTEVTAVVAAFIINYFVYLGYDSWFFSHLGKYQKMKNKTL